MDLGTPVLCVNAKEGTDKCKLLKVGFEGGLEVKRMALEVALEVDSKWARSRSGSGLVLAGRLLGADCLAG